MEIVTLGFVVFYKRVTPAELEIVYFCQSVLIKLNSINFEKK